MRDNVKIKASIIDKSEKYFPDGELSPSARFCVKPDLLSFSIPYPKFASMLENMDDCFLNTYVWENIRKRLDPVE